MKADTAVVVARMEALLEQYGSEQARPIRDIVYKIEQAGPSFYPALDWSKPDATRTIHVRWTNKVLQFDPAQAGLLEELAAKLEAEVSKPVYGIKRSPAVEKLVASRAENEDGALKLIKASAHMSIPSSNPYALIEGMRIHAELNGGPPMTLACTNQCLLVYVMSEEEVLERVRSVHVPKKRAAPEKVAVKMILLRVKKMHGAVREANDRLAEDMKDKDHKARMKNYPPDASQPVPPVPTDGDRASLIEFVNTVLGIRYRTKHNTEDLRKEVLKILRREDMTDSVIEEALRIAQVEEVMES